jgi:allantoin racemase
MAMRIWLQSNTALRTDPIWSAYTKAIEAHMDEIRRSDCEIRVEGVDTMEKNLEQSAFNRHLNVRQVLERGLQAQQEGYDAFVVIGMGTAGYEELRDLLEIVVVYAESVAWNFAAWQYRRFGLIGHERNVYFRRVEQIRAHGSLSFFVPGDYADVPEKTILASFANPGPLIEAFERSTAAAVRAGANVLIPDFNVLNDFLIASGVRQFHGVPIMDTSGIALKAAEMLMEARRTRVI